MGKLNSLSKIADNKVIAARRTISIKLDGISKIANIDNFMGTINPTILSWEDLCIKKIVNRNGLSKREIYGLKDLNRLLECHIDNLDEEFLKIVDENDSAKSVLAGLVTLNSYGSSYVKGKYDYINFRTSSLFTCGSLNNRDKEEMVHFFHTSGLRSMITNPLINDLTSVYLGVIYGVSGSNSRKNSTGSAMEFICKDILIGYCNKKGFEIIEQANFEKIKDNFNIEVNIDKKRFDFAIQNKEGKLYFIEVNYYASTGSKLKSCCQEYINSCSMVRQQGHEFLWITDGQGWMGSKNSLAEAYEHINSIINFNMIENNILSNIII